jgi:anti-anti-sigma factor
MSEEERTPVLRIEGELTIYRAEELCNALKTALAIEGNLDIDLANVTEIDSAGVQLLMAAQKSVQAAKRGMRLIDCSPAVTEVFGILDLHAYFDVSSSTPA